jgi:hypothetical protein
VALFSIQVEPRSSISTNIFPAAGKAVKKKDEKIVLSKSRHETEFLTTKKKQAAKKKEQTKSY